METTFQETRALNTNDKIVNVTLKNSYSSRIVKGVSILHCVDTFLVSITKKPSSRPSTKSLLKIFGHTLL